MNQISSAPNYKRTRFACYSAYFSMSSVFCVPPLLFVVFQNTYNVSYTLLGTLVLINFFTQLSIDLIFTFFAKFFNTKIVVRIMPLITSLGMFLYAFIPLVSPENAYTGFVIGTIIFSIAAGLSEVLLSPTIAAMPSDNPQRDMSLLHSLYAFGTFTMIVLCSVFLKIFHAENWNYFFFFLGALPIISAILFMCSPMPDMKTDSTPTKSIEKAKNRVLGLALCTACIFFGSCAENAMTNWISTYIENALHIDKTVGDILGMASFAILLGLGRILYSKFGKNIIKILLFGMIGACVCYLFAGLSSNVIVAFIACIATGFCTSMLWPGSLIMMEEKIPDAGVTAFALMAAGGDLGASIAPQLTGIVIDKVSTSNFGIRLAEKMHLSPEQIGLKSGMLVCSIFPLFGVITILILIKYFKKDKKGDYPTVSSTEE